MNDNIICKKLADVIIRVRKAKGLTQCDLAEKCDTTQDTISKIERGNLTSFRHIDKICEVLGIKLRIEVDMGTIELKKQF